MQLKAGKEYHCKTTGPNQMRAIDTSYFKVIGWGYYYLVTVMDDFSRFILAHKLQRDMTSDSFIEVVQNAVDKTGMMTEIPVLVPVLLGIHGHKVGVRADAPSRWVLGTKPSERWIRSAKRIYSEVVVQRPPAKLRCPSLD